MKKVLYSLLLMLPLLFVGCSENLDYRAAVREKDFEKAHAILNKLEDKLNDFYENNEMVEESAFTTNDYSNFHKFEKMCQNQIDAICTVYGEEMKYLADLNEPDAERRIAVLYQDACNDAQRIINKARQESSDTASSLEYSFNDNMQSIANLVCGIYNTNNRQ